MFSDIYNSKNIDKEINIDLLIEDVNNGLIIKELCEKHNIFL